MKTCKDCGETKPKSAFPLRKDSKDGCRPYCKPCHALRIKDVKTKQVSTPPKQREPSLTTDQKKYVYTAVIQRMKAQGLTSDKTHDEMLARVGEL